ncbi:hypothetical protein [Bacteroides ihuae]|uniref:hypothetical protein n=1 Tax=Bacteroides ihuae TaxID=1852362 RepID=UPI0008DB2182|nr:hypothetical protein [Bacteroides ihuae]
MNELISLIKKSLKNKGQRVVMAIIMYAPVGYLLMHNVIPEFESYNYFLKVATVIVLSTLGILLSINSLRPLLSKEFNKLDMYVCTFFAYFISILALLGSVLEFLYQHIAIFSFFVFFVIFQILFKSICKIKDRKKA